MKGYEFKQTPPVRSLIIRNLLIYTSRTMYRICDSIPFHYWYRYREIFDWKKSRVGEV